MDDFLRQRFGENSYERIDACLPPAKKQEALNKFNNKGGEQFVLLLEHRACSSSIKLSSMDIVFIFDTEFNPLINQSESFFSLIWSLLCLQQSISLSLCLCQLLVHWMRQIKIQIFSLARIHSHMRVTWLT